MSARRLVLNELLTSERMLTVRESRKMSFLDVTAEAPLHGQAAMPRPGDLTAVGVVVVARVGEFFGVIRARLGAAEWLGNRQHRESLNQ